ncbi:PfkB family carbohydrate kinase [Frankia sp. Cj3]|uniref:PfkB family carbohydrate kinase n=2 Tax=unclassified Frankia TaxID=2632575 RepID=UPI001EF413B4|nr:PfkB family carbohydrate kinase [Frankia sp. Cj3]
MRQERAAALNGALGLPGAWRPASNVAAMTIRSAEALISAPPLDYLAVGNPTVDVRPDASLAVGGSVVYAIIQAARLGLCAAGVGRGRGSELAPVWLPFATEAVLYIQPSADTTRFRNESIDGLRAQWLEKSAGRASGLDRLPESRVLHLAPVAREILLEEAARASARSLLGLTPQGLIRSWDEHGRVHHQPLEIDGPTAAHLDVVVFADYEAPYLANVAEAVRRAGGIVVVTKGAGGCEVLLTNGTQEFPAVATSQLIDDTGAGDVFASALFISLEGGSTVSEAVRFATAAAALSIEGIGPRAIASREEIDTFTGAASTALPL